MSKRYGVVDNVDLVDKAEIYTVTLPQGTRSYLIKTRGNTEFKIGFKPDLSTYATIPAGHAESEDDIFSEGPIKLYVQGEKSGEVLEVKYWIG